MFRTKLVALALVATLLVSGVAAGAPLGSGASVDDVGPPSDLPEIVPDFVGEILDSISSFLAGGLDYLGDLVSGLTPGGN